MQPATTPQPQATPNRMSSREVAELTGKRHDNVLRDIRDMTQALHSSKVSFVCEPAYYNASNGQRYEMLEMDKETTVCLLTGYDAAARMKVIQRWQALEGPAPVLAIPKTLSQALLLASQQAEQVEQLQLQLAEMQPAKAFYDAVADSKDGIPVTEAAKVLGIAGVGQNKLFEFLRREHILMTSRANWNMPYQEYVNREYFKVIETTNLDKAGNPRINMKTLVMQKGLDYIRKRLTVSS